MDYKVENLLKRVLDSHGLSHLYKSSFIRKRGFLDIFGNGAWANLIDGALKGLEVVAIATMDWKLTGIVKLLQSWIKDKREEEASYKQQVLYGANYDLTHPGSGVTTGTPPSYYY
jgi:hypothetical protein